jgi:hypothetical protein
MPEISSYRNGVPSWIEAATVERTAELDGSVWVPATDIPPGSGEQPEGLEHMRTPLRL